ncbi:MAG: hypothetical protein HAW58_00440 [Candidatus Thioglobus sp.]|nr:hypothetical protein [Candidatus Thioglobus sp.]
MRVKSKWHKTQVRTIEDVSSALAFNIWRITKNHLEDLINEAFVIEKAQVFAVIQEYLCFLIQSADRLVYSSFSPQQRQKLISLIIEQSAAYYQENKSDRLGEGEYWQEFIQTYASRAQDYSDYKFKNDEPNYLFLRYFADKIQKAMTAADEKWIVQQMVEIQAPKAFQAIQKSVNELASAKDIIAKKQSAKPKTPKTPRSKRPSTRADLQ